MADQTTTEIVWSIQNVRELGTLIHANRDTGRAVLSQCLFHPYNLSQSVWCLSMVLEGEIIKSLTAYLERYIDIDTSDLSIGWQVDLISTSYHKKWSQKNETAGKSPHYKLNLRVLTHELLSYTNGLLVQDTLRVSFRFWSKDRVDKTSNSASKLPKPITFIAHSRCGLQRTYSITSTKIDKNMRNGVMYEREKENTCGFPVEVKLYVEEGNLGLRFSSRSRVYMLVKAIYVEQQFNGTKKKIWNGEQAFKINTPCLINPVLNFRQLLATGFASRNSITVSLELVDYANSSICFAEREVVEEGNRSDDHVATSIFPRMSDKAISSTSDAQGDDRKVNLGRKGGDTEVCPLNSDLLQKGTFSDFTLLAGSESFPVHRAALCARSPVFEAMLTTPLLEASRDAGDVRGDFRPDTMCRLVRYLYSDAMPDLGPDSALELYSAADKYGVLTLRDRCFEVLVAGLSSQNVVPVLTLSERHGDQLLMDSAMDYIRSHDREVFVSPEWSNFMKEHPCLAAQVTHDFIMKKLDS